MFVQIIGLPNKRTLLEMFQFFPDYFPKYMAIYNVIPNCWVIIHFNLKVEILAVTEIAQTLQFHLNAACGMIFFSG